MLGGLLRIGAWLFALVCLVWIALGVALGELAIHAPRRVVTQAQSDEATAIARAAGHLRRIAATRSD